MFSQPEQLGAGAPAATSPEVLSAAVNGPDDDAKTETGLWELMRSCDVWAAGRMMFEQLLLCTKGAVDEAGKVGLPPLNTTAYKASDLPPLPGYSAELRGILAAMMEYKQADRLGPEAALARFQVLLWGRDAAPGADAITTGNKASLHKGSSMDDVEVWLQCQRARACRALATTAVLRTVVTSNAKRASAAITSTTTTTTAAIAATAAGAVGGTTGATPAATGGAGAGAGAGGEATGAVAAEQVVSRDSDVSTSAALARLAGGGAGCVSDHVAGSLWAAFVSSASAATVQPACQHALST